MHVYGSVLIPQTQPANMLKKNWLVHNTNLSHIRMSHYCIVIKTVDLVTLGFLVPSVLPSKPSSPLQWASSSNSHVQVFWSCHPYWVNHESDNYDKYEWYWPMNVMVTCGCDNYTILTCNSQWFCKGHLHAETKLCNLGIRLDTYFAAWIKKWLCKCCRIASHY